MPIKYSGYVKDGEPIFFSANYCPNDEQLKAFNRGRINCDEIVSFDTGLFSMRGIDRDEIGVPDENTQFIAAIRNPPQSPCTLLSADGRFEFAGYDLVESFGFISAITNCNAGFGLVIDYGALNRFGLISDYKTALKTKNALEEYYPDEPHAECDIIEMWRYGAK